MSLASPPVTRTHPFGFSICNREIRSAGSSPPLWFIQKGTSVPLGETGFCSWTPRLGQFFASGPRQGRAITASTPAPGVPVLVPRARGGQAGPDSMGLRPSRPRDPRRKEAHCPQRNTFCPPPPPREKAAVLNFRRKSSSLAPRRERFVVASTPPTPGGPRSTASSQNICRGKIHPGGQIALALSPENSLKRY